MRPALLLLLTACGSPPEPTPACDAWVACIEARDAERGVTTDADRFRAGGACWNNAEGAEICDTACDNGLALLRRSEPDLPTACAE